MVDLIHGRVARILNSRELVINRGGESGVRVGMRFAVLDTTGEGITDPDTGEELGSVLRPKVQLEVTQVSDRIAVAKTYKLRSVNLGGSNYQLGNIASMFAPARVVQRPETLKVEDADWEPLTESRSFVKVGDPVVEINADDQDEVGGIIVSISDPDQLALESSGESSNGDTLPKTGS
jgi:hypothetical protein